MQEQPKRQYGEFVEPERKLLEQAVFGMARNILIQFPHELPDYLLPETSGRLAELLLGNILAKAAAQRGVPAPEGFRITTASSRDIDYMSSCAILDKDMLRDTWNSLSSSSPTIARMAFIINSRRGQQQNSADIIQQIRKEEARKNPLIILDDLVAGRVTWKEIQRAFGRTKGNYIPLFALFDDSPALQDDTLPIYADSSPLYSDIPSLFTPGEAEIIRGAKKIRTIEGMKIEEIEPSTPQQVIFKERILREISDLQIRVLKRLIAEGLLPSSSETKTN